MEHLPKSGEEWGGQQSSKFLRTKMHVKPVEHSNEKHPLFSTLGRKHIPEQQFRRDQQSDWKPTKNIQHEPKHWIDKNNKKIIEKYTIVVPKSQRMSIVDNMSAKLKKKKLEDALLKINEEKQAVKDLDDWEATVLVKEQIKKS